VKAVWNGTVLAASDDTVVVEGNHYFPRAAVASEHLVESGKTTRCPWKGKASYFHVEARGERNPDAAWTYPKPWPLARRIRGRVAFGDGVAVVSD
jgi:uncharacterized protein (DUF427 family)